MLGYGLSLLSTVFFSIMALFLPFAYAAGITPREAIFYETFFAASCFYIYMRLTREKLAPLNKKNFWNVFFVCICGKSLAIIGYNYAIAMIDVSLATAILFTYPAFVVLLEMLIDHRRIRLPQILGLLCSLTGGLLVIDIFGSQNIIFNPIGVLLCLLSGFSWGFMMYWSNKKLTDMPTMSISAYTQYFSIILFFIFYPPVDIAHDITNYTGMFWLFLCGVATIFSNQFMFLSIKMIGAARSSVISIMELPITVILCFMILGERMVGIQLAGMGFIILGILLFEWNNVRAVLERRKK